MTKFHNPYHFVPTGSKPPSTTTKDNLPTEVTHDRYVEGTHSGRLVCKVTVETPTLCGNEQEEREDWTKLIKLSKDRENNPILPASQLRGMISSVAEAASGSALRVLEKRTLSVRQDLQQGLTAMGMIVEKKGGLYLYPLASPHYTLRSNNFPNGDTIRDRGKILPQNESKKSEPDYSRAFPKYRPKIYFGNRTSIRDDAFLRNTFSSGTPGKSPFYGIRKEAFEDKITRRGMNHVLLGKKSQSKIFSWEEGMEKDHLRGIVRCLGVYPSREEGMKNKKFEYFFPFSEEDQKKLAHSILPIDPMAIKRFHSLADQRASDENKKDSKEEDLLPYGPNGTSRGKRTDARSGSWTLKTGDIVFFRPSKDGASVVEVSLSSAWRKRIETNNGEDAGVEAFLPDPDFAPLSEKRNNLTIAERLFGVVEDRADKQEYQAFALASRLSVHPGILGENQEGKNRPWQDVNELLTEEQKNWAVQNTGKEVPLLNLQSPKPPSPNLYFKMKNGPSGYIRKTDLAPENHTVQGRKFYLRRPVKTACDPKSEYYVGGNNAFVHADTLSLSQQHHHAGKKALKTLKSQHQSANNFIRPETVFYFSIDYYNLIDEELNLLLYSLQPTDSFHHMIGHGKPLGFGQIKVEPVGLLEVDRAARYTAEGFEKDRYDTIELLEETSSWPASLQHDLPSNPRVGGALRPDSQANQVPDSPNPETFLTKARKFHKKWAEGNGLKETIDALEIIGDPGYIDAPIHYPQLAGIDSNNQNFHTKHFSWFGENDKRENPERLQPISKDTGIPKLKKHRRPQRNFGNNNRRPRGNRQ